METKWRIVTDLQDGYAGVRTCGGPVVVRIRRGEQKPLPHVIRHSPTGYEWGYGGSGPADLALSILADVIGPTTADYFYQDFKWEFVAAWSDRWEIRRDEILRWLETRGGQAGG